METKEYLQTAYRAKKRIVLHNNEYCKESYGEHTFKQETIQPAYDKEGNYIDDITSTKLVDRNTNVIYSDERFHVQRCMVQINFNFYLIPIEGYLRLDDIHRDIKILNNSTVFNNTDFTTVRKERYTTIPETKNMVNVYDIDTGKNESYELTINNTNTVTIVNRINPKNIDAKQYRENYKKALKKYPEYKDVINKLFNANCQYHKIKSYKRKPKNKQSAIMKFL